jgi:small subunit ribosomal protein S4
MARYTGPKNRIARRFGTNIFGRSRNPLLHKPNPPGQHGARRRKKSDFGVQLDEKQKLKAVYGMISEKSLVKYYHEALQKKGAAAQLLLARLECRLDNVVYRLKLAKTIFGAQQLVAHGHILVDGKKVDIRSFEVKPGMVVSLKDKARQMRSVLEARDSSLRTVPDYLKVDESTGAGTLLTVPDTVQIQLPIEINMAVVCDFLAYQHG